MFDKISLTELVHSVCIHCFLYCFHSVILSIVYSMFHYDVRLCANRTTEFHHLLINKVIHYFLTIALTFLSNITVCRMLWMCLFYYTVCVWGDSNKILFKHFLSTNFFSLHVCLIYVVSISPSELTVWPGVGRVRVIVGVAVLVVAVLIAVLCCYRRGRNGEKWWNHKGSDVLIVETKQNKKRGKKSKQRVLRLVFYMIWLKHLFSVFQHSNLLLVSIVL